MLLISLVLACAVGTVAGILNVAVLGATLWSGVATYFAVSAILPVVLLSLMMVARMVLPQPAPLRSVAEELEDWQDRQFEEEMAKQAFLRDNPAVVFEPERRSA